MQLIRGLSSETSIVRILPELVFHATDSTMSNAELKRTAFDPALSRRPELINIVAGGFEFAANSKPL